MSVKNILTRDKRRYVLPSERARGHDTHDYLPELSDQLEKNVIHRRDFLRQAALLGLSAGAAYGLAGKLTGQNLIAPAMAAGKGKPGGTLRVSMAVQAINDPAVYSWTEPSNICRLMCEYIVRTGMDNVTRPYLAEKWEASDDLKTWVFHLRRNVTWSNGDKFGADDLIHNLNRWLDPKTGSSNMGLFAALVQTAADGKTKSMIPGAVEKVDDYTVKLNLNQASLSIPENFYNYPTAIVHRGFGKDYEADLSKNPIGTGCFTLADYAVGVKAILKKNREWWAGDFYLNEVHYFDHGQDTNAWLAAIASGQVDALFRLSNDSIDAAKKLKNIDIYDASTAQTAVMRFRVSEKPFDNPKVRAAVVAAMDNQEILTKGYKGLGVAGENHHVSPIHPEYAPLPKMKRDVALAKKLLTEAGYPNGIDLTIDNGDTDGSWMTDCCAVMKSQVEAAGIRVNINKMPSAQYWEIWDKTKWGFTSWTHRPLGTMVLSLAYRANVPWNESAYNNPEFDKALNDAESTLDVNERKKKMVKVETILQNDNVIPQPFWRKEFTASGKKVKGYGAHPTNYLQLQDVWLDS